MRRLAALLLVTSGCYLPEVDAPADGGTDAGLDGGSSRVTPYVVPVFSSGSITVFTNRLSWSPDGTSIAFEGGVAGSSDVFRVQAREGAEPVRVTKWDAASWEGGGEAPNWLADGRLTFYAGWLADGDDQDMHLMVADPTTQDGVPAPSVLRRFNGSHVGLQANAAASPEAVSITTDALRALFVWSSTEDRTWLLDFSGTDVASTQHPGALAISPDGARLVTTAADGTLSVEPLGEGTPLTLERGTDPSWASATLLGWVSSTGGEYVVRDVVAGTTTRTPASGRWLQNATLSPDGRRVAFRTFAGASTGVSILVLSE